MTDLRQQLQDALGTAFTVDDELTGGGMSRVFVATDTTLARRVAVKVLARGIADAIALQRFEREILTLAGLQHPNIVPVLTTGTVDGLPWFMMPYVDGESLGGRLQRGPLSVRETVHIARDVTRALSYAHARGIVHRDIKPDNILLARDSAMVTDFGIAKAIVSAREEVQEASPALTGAGWSLGTPLYMAPEQVAADPRTDHRADIYSLGAVLYEMLAGRPPFDAPTRQALLAAQLTETPAPLARSRPDIPVPLAAAIDRCLAKKPDDRWQNADMLLRALEQAAMAAASGTTDATTARPVRHAMRTPIAMGAAVAALALAAVIAVVQLRAPRTEAGSTSDPASDLAAGAAPSEGVPRALSIALLPVDMRSATASAAYLADGVRDELADRLTRVPGVRLVSSTSVAYARERYPTIAELGTALGVQVILEWSMTIAPPRIRLVTRLVDAHRDSLMWTSSYEASVNDIAAMQDTLTRDLATRLAVLAPVAPGTRADARVASAAAESRDARAYDAYLRALHLLRTRRADSLQRAVQLLQTATQVDPAFARAYAALARAYALLPLYAGVSPDAVRGPALAAVERAIALDPMIADAYTSRGAMLAADWRRDEADRDFTRALTIDSSNVTAWQWRGELRLVRGRIADAVHDLRRAAELDPYSTIVTGSLAIALAHAGRVDSARQVARFAVSLDSMQPIAHVFEAAIELEAGDVAAAGRAIARAAALDSSALTRGVQGYIAARRGDTATADRIATRLARDSARTGALVGAARVAIALGDTARALDLLQRAADRRDPMFGNEFLGGTMFAPLRGSARFSALLVRVGLDGVQARRVPPR